MAALIELVVPANEQSFDLSSLSFRRPYVRTPRAINLMRNLVTRVIIIRLLWASFISLSVAKLESLVDFFSNYCRICFIYSFFFCSYRFVLDVSYMIGVCLRFGNGTSYLLLVFFHKEIKGKVARHVEG